MHTAQPRSTVPATAGSNPSGNFDASELERLIDGADAISFDFFDTLFVRPLLDPEDAFDIIGQRHKMQDFRQRRRAAQTAAFRNMLAAGRREITLQEIYSCFEADTATANALMHLEQELELELIEPNPELFPLFQRLVESGKTVVITSDMYFSRSFFVTALRPFGLENVRLYISADCNATKRDSGELFEQLICDLQLAPERILHIGDNLLADVTRPREKGLSAFHYLATRLPPKKKGASLALSLSHGLLRTRGGHISAGSYEELGFLYGGPAALGFLQWIEEQAKRDRIDHVLFLSRDGYILERLARQNEAHNLPHFEYFLGSRIAYSLASIDECNFEHFLPFLLSGCEGLAPCELLERIGVPPPSEKVMADLGLSAENPITAAVHERLAQFLYAYRWQILQVCQRNRRALFHYLRQVGLKDGQRVALVDVGWSGSTQEAFEQAVKPLMKLETVGYYFCLADTAERAQREQTQRMSALISSGNTDPDTVAKLYANRVAVELFFSAPHHSIIGLQPGSPVRAVEDAGRGTKDDLKGVAAALCKGMQSFADFYHPLHKRLDLRNTPQQLAWPMVELVNVDDWSSMPLIQKLRNIDAWGSTQHRALTINDYLNS